MKNYLFLFLSFFLAATATGQQAAPSKPFANQYRHNSAATSASCVAISDSTASIQPAEQSATLPAERTTGTGGARWYDYVDSVLGMNTFIGWTNLYMWNDTTAWFWEPGGAYQSANFESAGLILDPFAPGWSNTAVFPNNEISVSHTNAYVIDSLIIGGAYLRNNSTPAKAGVVDTLIVQFVSGNGGGISGLKQEVYASALSEADYGVNTVIGMDMYYDPVNNRAGGINGIADTMGTYKFLLTADDELDSTNYTPSGMNIVYPRASHATGSYADSAIHFSVAAGYYVGVSVSYKSGDPALTHRYGNDTAVLPGWVYEYNDWEPLVWYAQEGSAVFPPYINKDWTSGCILCAGGLHVNHLELAGSLYIPNWDLVSGSTIYYASEYQYPAISFHVQCPTCATLAKVTGIENTTPLENTISAYPNPAADELNIAYTLAQSSPVSITLTNVIGQVVATRKIPDANRGNAVINTYTLPDGLYIYTLEANGNRTTGQVTINH